MAPKPSTTSNLKTLSLLILLILSYPGYRLLLKPQVLPFKKANASSKTPTETTEAARSATQRIRLLAFMHFDLFMRAERALYELQNHYEEGLGRTPDVLSTTSQHYKIHLYSQQPNELLLSAKAQNNQDKITVDQNFKVTSNFTIPTPPKEYLFTVARHVMNKMAQNRFEFFNQAQQKNLEGIFSGYFEYELRTTSNQGRTLIAKGIKPPVLNETITMQPNVNIFAWVKEFEQNENIDLIVNQKLTNLQQAQEIHRGHVGSYAADFQSLAACSNQLDQLNARQPQPLQLQEFALDPNFGFHAEVSFNNQANQRSPASLKSWSINGYGQIQSVNNIEDVIQQLNQINLKIPHQIEGSRN